MRLPHRACTPRSIVVTRTAMHPTLFKRLGAHVLGAHSQWACRQPDTASTSDGVEVNRLQCVEPEPEYPNWNHTHFHLATKIVLSCTVDGVQCV